MTDHAHVPTISNDLLRDLHCLRRVRLVVERDEFELAVGRCGRVPGVGSGLGSSQHFLPTELPRVAISNHNREIDLALATVDQQTDDACK